MQAIAIADLLLGVIVMNLKQNSCNQPAPNALAPMAIRTTLFDLISGIHAEEGSHVSDGITAAVIDAFKIYRISIDNFY